LKLSWFYFCIFVLRFFLTRQTKYYVDMKKFMFFLIIFSGIFASIQAQTGKLFTTDNELSNSLINTIFQDSKNYIWIATEDGLNKYDGIKFSIYRTVKGNSHSLKNNYVRSLFEDSKGRFWVGCVNGLMLYDRVNDSFTEIPLYFGNKIIEPHVSSIIETQKGEILISTSSDAILRFDSKNNRFKVDDQLLPRLCSRYIVSVFEDSKQNLWIASADKGVNCYNERTGEIKLFKAPESLGNNQISSIIEDDKGFVFVGTLAGGLFKLNPLLQKFEPVIYNKDANNLPIKTLFFDKQKRLLIGTDGRGVKVYNRLTNQIEDFEVQSATFDFSHTKVHSILLDKVGNLWIGLFQKGVFLSPNHTNKFKYFGSKSFNNNLIGTNCVMSLYKDNAGVLWVGTDHDGIYAIDNTNRSHHFELKGNQSSIASTIMTIIEGDANTLWLGSYLDGLIKFDKRSGNYQRFSNISSEIANNPSTNRVISLLKDNRNRLWIGTNGGGVQLFDIATSRFTAQYSSNVNNVGGLVNNWINCLANDGDSLIWIGTYGGVNSVNLKTGKIQTITKNENLLSSNIIYSIELDKRGNVWFGTSDGLTRYNKKKHKSVFYTTTDGLPSNVIRGIVEDERGDMWLSTHTGISKYMVKENKFVNHFALDGLQGNEFTMGAAFKAKTGEVFFGGVGGVTSFFPSKIINQKDSIKIYLTGLYVLDRPVVKGQKSGAHEIIDNFISDVETIRLSYEDNMFSMEFSTFNFGNSERVYYRYKLEGLNSQWINTSPGTNRISFTNLDYGSYTLRVKACVNDNVSVEKLIKIRIYPPWYLTFFAKLIYFLLFMALVYGVIRYITDRMQHRQEMIRREHLEQVNEGKLQFFINISHEIRTPMTLIISPLEKLMTDTSSPERTQAYHLMYRNAQRILRLINQLLDLRKIDKGLMFVKMRETNIVSFIDDIIQTFEYQSEKREIALEFQHDSPELMAWIDMNNFDKVLVNILSNGFKFTPDKGTITVKLSEGSDETAVEPLKHYFEIVVSDNGVGIEEDKIEKIFERFYQIDHSQNNVNFGTGIGLHLSRNLVHLQHGVIFARNRKDVPGSEFVIRLPLGSKHLTDMEKEHLSTEIPTSVFRSANENLMLEDSAVEIIKVKPKTKYRVLIVDDEPEIRHYLKQNLADTYRVFESLNGKEALEFILKEKPDLVISDLMMPEMDGITLCKKLKSNININHIPIVLLTAKTSDEDKAEGFEIGADAYVAKPFNVELLKKRVANIIENRARLEDKISDSPENKELIKPVVLRSNDQILLEKIIKIINENIDNSDLNVEMLADGVGMSRVHMHRKLKELTNQSARDFIKSIRLKQASELLTTQRLTISEVAYALGFSNLSHFSNTFKEFYGMSPKEYAERNWKGDE
jgi:signal transduction histidine kinase/ligand-binding sensor domain-containing protein/AraC-like DNA-binding protein/AmiR/NasT family two-component response regulator